ncbi:MAG: acyl-CoA desaturase [Flavitalea sp.]
MSAVIFFVVMWYLSLFSQTFFYHRYASHGAFTMSKFWERFFFVFSYFAQGSHFLSPAAYAVMHRMHHAYTDTPNDPHSPNYSKNLFAMMWRTRNFYRNIAIGKTEVDPKFAKNLPHWPSLEKWGGSAISRVLWSVIYLAVFIALDTPWWLYFLLPVIMAMGAFHGAIINWFAHKFGYINFRLRNTAQNLFSLDIFMLGESYHNNHHKNPSSINFGVKWHELDPVYPVIRFLNWIKVIRIKKADNLSDG